MPRGWACDRALRPARAAAAWLEGTELVLADGRLHRGVSLPVSSTGPTPPWRRVAAPLMAPPGVGRDGEQPSGARPDGPVSEVAGRFATVGGRRPRRADSCWPRTRPAGPAVFDLLDEPGGTGAGGAVGQRPGGRRLRPSWLWDVPFERLAGRPVVATGDRRLDLAVRLRYAEVDHARWWRTRWPRVDRAVGAPDARARGRAGRLPRQLHGLRRPAAPAVSGARRSAAWRSPWSTPTCSAPTGTAGTG